jgi:hypothetical protein
MTDTSVEKTIILDGNICYVLDKCCSIKGYAYRLGYIDPKKLYTSQIIYKKRVSLPQGYHAEVCVRSDAWDNPTAERCWTDMTLYSPEGIEVAHSDKKNIFTGVHNVKSEDLNFFLLISP